MQVGDLRLVASLEVLNGLLLIGWSTSFTYLSMLRYWKLHDGNRCLRSTLRVG